MNNDTNSLHHTDLPPGCHDTKNQYYNNTTSSQNLYQTPIDPPTNAQHPSPPVYGVTSDEQRDQSPTSPSVITTSAPAVHVYMSEDPFSVPNTIKTRHIIEYPDYAHLPPALPRSEQGILQLNQHEMQHGIDLVDPIPALDHYLHPDNNRHIYRAYCPNPAHNRIPYFILISMAFGFLCAGVILTNAILFLSQPTSSKGYTRTFSFEHYIVGFVALFCVFCLTRCLPGTYKKLILENKASIRLRLSQQNPLHYLILNASRSTEDYISTAQITEKLNEYESGIPTLAFRIRGYSLINPNQQNYDYIEEITIPIIRSLDISYHPDSFAFIIDNAYLPYVGVQYHMTYQLHPAQEELFMQYRRQLRQYWLRYYRFVDVDFMYVVKTPNNLHKKAITEANHKKNDKQFANVIHVDDWVLNQSYFGGDPGVDPEATNFHASDPHKKEKISIKKRLKRCPLHGIPTAFFFWVWTFMYYFPYIWWTKSNQIVKYTNKKYLHLATPQHSFFGVDPQSQPPKLPQSDPLMQQDCPQS